MFIKRWVFFPGKQKRKGFEKALDEIENNPGIKTAEMLVEEELKQAGLEGGDALVMEGEPVTEAVAEGGAVAPQEEAPMTPNEKKTPARGKKKSAGATPASAATPAASRAAKRKAPADEDAAATPPAAKAARTATPAAGDAAAATPGSENRTSRSGRVLKPKKFVGEDGAGSAPATPKDDGKAGAVTPGKKEDRKMYVQVKATGEVVEVNIDADRPEKFDTKEQEVQWERATAKNALKFKEKVEGGEFIPDAVRRKIEEKLHRTPEEEAILRKEKETSIRKEKVRVLI